VFALLSGLLPLLIMETEPTLGQEVLFVLPVIILLLISIIAMFWINRHLRKQAENMQLQLIAESSP
jgi:divalent metal cation (Fe/Co/Zn/Cd) transporter